MYFEHKSFYTLIWWSQWFENYLKTTYPFLIKWVKTLLTFSEKSLFPSINVLFPQIKDVVVVVSRAAPARRPPAVVSPWLPVAATGPPSHDPHATPGASTEARYDPVWASDRGHPGDAAKKLAHHATAAQKW